MDMLVDDVPLGLGLKANIRLRNKLKRKKPNEVLSKAKEAKKFRAAHDIKVSGSSALGGELPLPEITFTSLVSSFPSFNQHLLNNVGELSFSVPTPVQAQAIPIMLKLYSPNLPSLTQNGNLLACAPTGSGKTAAYLIPVLQAYCARFLTTDTELEVNQSSQPKPTSETPHRIALFGLILAPTQELVRQIWSEAARLSRGLPGGRFIAYLSRRHYAYRGKSKYKVNSRENSKNALTKLRELRLPRSTRILVATPCRMAFLLSLDPSLCPFDVSNLVWLVLDEYDKMLEVDVTNANSLSSKKMRHRVRSFRDQINPIFHALSKARSISGRQPSVAMFSATVPDEVVNWAQSELPALLSPTGEQASGKFELVQLCVGTRNSAVSTVKQELRYCATEEGKLLEIRYLLVRGLLYPCLIFMESRERAKELIKEILLSDANVLANVISSDKTDAQRAAIIRAFREGQLNVLVCTDLLGRGIDFKGVNMVVNYDLPPSKEEYIHRVGRTGRAGRLGRAITLWTDADLPRLGEVLKVMRRSGCEVDPELERLVAEWHSRRSQFLLAKRKGPAAGDLSEHVIISKRRGERRLIHNLIRKQRRKGIKVDTEDDASADSDRQIKWLRRWNPYRKRISDLSSARQNKRTQK
ncbi:helicase protein [Opisthorchis viverrini]|uniref:RNA helicase n=1 Tax=Opisthorchis viverrini TaxID=6198 RepID=A0A1S8WJN5_OPIVI|nr:helicase protein [Opisthorchis viverrini]